PELSQPNNCEQEREAYPMGSFSERDEMSQPLDWINEKVLIPDLLRTVPAVRPVLDRYGLHGCGGELGPVESLAFFAKAHDVPIGQLLEEIRQAAIQP